MTTRNLADTHMRRVIRNLQTFFPALQDARYRLKFAWMQSSGRPHEEDFEVLRRFPDEGPPRTFVDIGSNRGEAITSMRMLAADNVDIVGFEPNPLIFAKLKAYVDDCAGVTVHNCGLSDVDADHELHVPFYRGWMFDGLSSFVYSRAEDWLRTRMWGYRERNLEVKSVQCALRRLDDFQLDPYFVKIDVQGYEMEVLRGAETTLKLSKPILLIESLEAPGREFLAGLGYDFYRYSDGTFYRGRGSLNTFCMTAERYAEVNGGTEVADVRPTPAGVRSAVAS